MAKCQGLLAIHFPIKRKLEMSRDKQEFKIKVPDAIIVATSIHKNIPLITFDKGFATIKSLDLILLEL